MSWLGFVSGVFVGAMLGVIVMALAATAGESSEAERVRESYRAGVMAGRTDLTNRTLM